MAGQMWLLLTACGVAACAGLTTPAGAGRAAAARLKEYRLLGAGCDSALTLEGSSSVDELGARTRPFELPGGCAVSVRETSFGEAKLGYSVWTAGVGLATWLCANPSLTRGKHILELGSGTGLAGFACAALGRNSGSSVTLSDMGRVRADDWDSPTGLLESLERSAVENGLGVRVRRIDWREHALSGLSASPAEAGAPIAESHGDDRYEVVIAADCVYYKDLLAPLVATLRRFLAPGGRAYVMSTSREGAADHSASPSQFAALLREVGWCEVEEQLCTCVTPYTTEIMVLHEIRWREASEGEVPS